MPCVIATAPVGPIGGDGRQTRHVTVQVNQLNGGQLATFWNVELSKLLIFGSKTQGRGIGLAPAT